MRTVEITVTAAHIARGKRCTSTACPVALAIKETLHPLSVNVQSEVINFGVPGGKFSPVRPPAEAAYFVDEFDDGIPVKPFTFTLDVPDAVVAA